MRVSRRTLRSICHPRYRSPVELRSNATPALLRRCSLTLKEQILFECGPPGVCMQLVLRNFYFMDLIDDLHAQLYAEKQFAVDTHSVLSVEVVMPERFVNSADAHNWYAALPAVVAEILDPMTGWVLMDVLTPSYEHPNLLIRLRGRNPLEVLCDAPPTSP